MQGNVEGEEKGRKKEAYLSSSSIRSVTCYVFSGREKKEGDKKKKERRKRGKGKTPVRRTIKLAIPSNVGRRT